VLSSSSPKRDLSEIHNGSAFCRYYNSNWLLVFLAPHFLIGEKHGKGFTTENDSKDCIKQDMRLNLTNVI
jgi:hypothetical protein